jgi:predicted phosphodiesterase
MRIVVITDVHANLPALRAALQDINKRGYDTIYHTGDALGIGPYQAECLDLLLSTPRMRFVMGNHDAWFAFGLPDPWPHDPGELVHQRWVHAQLSSELRVVVAQWPSVIQEMLGDGPAMAFLHYAPQGAPGNFAKIIHEPTPKDLDRLFAPYPADIVCYDHHHPFSDMMGQRRYVNPGSLGCHSRPLARYALLESGKDGTYMLEHHAVPCDHAPLLAEMERRQVPERELICRVFLPRQQTEP